MFRRTCVRFNSTLVKPRPRPTWRSNLSAPLFKSLMLTLVFGSAVVEASKRRKELESLENAYETRFSILNDTIKKLRLGLPVNVSEEIKVANAITRNKYSSISDVELDDQFNELLQLAESQVESTESTESPLSPVEPIQLTSQTPKHLDTSKFL